MQISTTSVPAHDPKRRVLKDVFGFDDFRPGQASVMEALLAGRHVLAVMPTGAGKSLCYQVPALVKGGLTIVETVVYWHPPHCYAYKAEGTHLPFKNYLGLFQVEPIDDQSGKFIFREYFDGAGRVGEALLPHGVAAVFHKALGNLARLIGGTEYAMTAVSRA